MSFQMHDVVRVTRLLVPAREVDGSVPQPPQPRAGETGVIVELLGDGLYLVERVTADGRTYWMAEFLAAELELADAGDDSARPPVSME